MSATHAPWQQGALDSLCGIYSVINGIQYAAPDPGLSKQDASYLFGEIAYELESRSDAGDLIGYGLTRRSLCTALRTADTWLTDNYDLKLRANWPFYRSTDVSLSEIFDALQSHLLQPHSAAVCAIMGCINHWTVITEFTPGRIRLFDSYGMKFIRTSSVGPLGSDEARYQLPPTNMVFIQITEAT